MGERRWGRAWGLAWKKGLQRFVVYSSYFSFRLELLSIVPCEGTKSSRRIIYKKREVRSPI